jgi:hypothetical protein
MLEQDELSLEERRLRHAGPEARRGKGREQCQKEESTDESVGNAVPVSLISAAVSSEFTETVALAKRADKQTPTSAHLIRARPG